MFDIDSEFPRGLLVFTLMGALRNPEVERILVSNKLSFDLIFAIEPLDACLLLLIDASIPLNEPINERESLRDVER